MIDREQELRAANADLRTEIKQLENNHRAELKRLEAELTAAAVRIDNDADEIDALKLDAGRYKWLQENHKSWSWNPSQYAAETTSGFAALGTGYLGYGFTDAVDAAMKEGVQ